MTISVIIPFYNAALTLGNCLKGLAAQSRPADEIIFIDNASNDEGAAVVRDFSSQYPELKIRLFQESKRGAAAARNRGLREVTGDTIAFTDADAVPREDWLETIEKFYRSGNWDGLGGVYRAQDARGVSEKYQVIEMTFPKAFTGKRVEDKYQCLFGQLLSTCNASYRKKVLDAIGGFEEKLVWAGEDTDLTMRAVEKGFKILSWHPEVVVWHAPRTLWGYWKRIFQYRAVLAPLVRKHCQREIVLQLPKDKIVRVHFLFTLVFTKEFFFLTIVFLAALLFCFFKLSWGIFLAAFAVLTLRFAWNVWKRIKSIGMKVSVTELAGIVAADWVQKFFSESGRIYGSIKHRRVIL